MSLPAHQARSPRQDGVLAETLDHGPVNFVATSKGPVSVVAAEFGRRVREHRTQLGLSQEKLAELAGLHWTFVGQVERGRRNLTLHNIVKLADALQLDAGRLTAGLGQVQSSD